MPSHSTHRRFGLRPKILLLLVGILCLTTVLDVMLAWYFTEYQNQRDAYDVLSHNLHYWEDDLQGQIKIWQSTASDTLNDERTANELERLVALERELDRPGGDPRARVDLERRLANAKAASLGRLILAVRAARISSIFVYVNGSLSHYVSSSEAGMFVTRTAAGKRVWIASIADPTGSLRTDNWPSWEERAPPIVTHFFSPDLTEPTLSVDFTAPDAAVVQDAVPLVANDGISWESHPLLSADHSAFAPAAPRPSTAADGAAPERALVIVVIFRKRLDRQYLQQTARKTGKWPAIFSLDGLHRQELEPFDVDPHELATLQAPQSQSGAAMLERIAGRADRSVYQKLLVWQYAGRPVLILGLASLRTGTVHNIRQTVTAILVADGAILLLSIALGAFWVRRFIDPIVTFTAEVKDMEHRSRLGTEAGPKGETLVEELKPLSVMAPDEVGDLASAFNAMILELRRSLETLERRMQERIARDAALAEAERSARRRDDFFAQTSHELRTPLNAILGYAQILLRDRTQLTDRQVVGLTTIQESGEHLLALIDDILDLSRAREAKLELSPDNIALAVFLKGVVDIVGVKAEQRSLWFRYEVSPDLPAIVYVDEKRLRQVLLNLLGNAIKFTDRGGVVLRVQRASTPGPGSSPDRRPLVRLRFDVEDTGIGMSEEQLSKIFRPFEQVSDSLHREGGTGLGLAITRSLIRLMGGEIHVQSKPAAGSRFFFELDLAAEASSLLHPESPRFASGYRGPRKRILVADDVLQNRLMQMQLLAQLGFDVDEASDGQKCLEQAERVRPDLVLMDVMMPGMDGLEATRRLRGRPGFAQLPIVVVSASTADADRARCFAAGASAFIAKPLQIGTVMQVLGEQLGLSWIYEDSSAGPENAQESDAGMLVIPSPLEIEALHQLALAGNMRAIRDRAERLRAMDARYEAFAARLLVLAQQCESQAITRLIERYRTRCG